MDAYFISQEEAVTKLGKKDTAFVDGSWYLPGMARNPKLEYAKMRIPGAVYFDLDVIADTASSLPHMLPSPNEFAKHVSLLGISDTDEIIVYDGPGLFSAARVWWMFTIMGAKNVRILNGGLDAWKSAQLPLETGNPNPPAVRYFEARYDAERVAPIDKLQNAVDEKTAIVLDARPADRFHGKAPEPRQGLRSGRIPGALNLPISRIVKSGKLVTPQELEAIFDELNIGKQDRVVTSCGSGVTAGILSLALTITGRDNHALYDGSWAEWGLEDGPPIETEND